MTAPNMATITASLERSLQNCSLNHHQNGGGGGAGVVGVGVGVGGERSSSLDDALGNHLTNSSDDTTLELNSQISLPYHWEQCLDLKTGEIYYINWSNGMKAREDPRTVAESSGDFYSEEDDNSSYDSEESSSESSPPSLLSSSSRHQQQQHYGYGGRGEKEDHVLVVAGCKSCFMYYMVPKQAGDCPKCTGQLLHFDRSENRS